MRKFIQLLVTCAAAGSIAFTDPRAVFCCHEPGCADDAASKPGAAVSHVVRAREAKAPWVAVAPANLVAPLELLAVHRLRRGAGEVSIVTLESIVEDYKSGSAAESLRNFSRDCAKRGGAKLLFIVGDASAFPPHVLRLKNSTAAVSDVWFVDDNDDLVPDRAAGRFPSTDVVLLQKYVDRVVAYENDIKPAGWRRRITFVGGSGGFGAAVDKAIESTVTNFLDQDIPPEFDLRVLRPDENSVYGTPADTEKSSIIDLWNSGALVTIFAGHGSRHGIHTAVAEGFTRPVMLTKDLSNVQIRGGYPLVLLLACDTGQFETPRGVVRLFRDSEAEASSGQRTLPASFAAGLLVNPSGAIAVIGASENSHPFPDILLARGLNALFTKRDRMPVGEMLRQAKHSLIHDRDEFRKRIEGIADFFGLKEEERERLVQYEANIFTLFGDPGVVLNGPDLATKVEVKKQAVWGGSLEFSVHCDAPDGASVIYALEFARKANPRKQGYPAANDRTITRGAGELKGGRFDGTIRIPNSSEKTYVLVAEVRAPSAMGASAVIIQKDE